MKLGKSRRILGALALMIGSTAIQAHLSFGHAEEGSGSADSIDEGDGAIPLSPEEFAKLPKTATYRAYLPAHVDLSKRFPVPGDQGAIGSCTAWAVGYAARSYYSVAAEGRNVADPANIPSPGYIYGATVLNPGKCDSGARVSDALALLKNDGAQSLKAFPYSRRACRPPTANQRASASDFKIADWLAVEFTNVDQVKGELAKGHPVIISLRDTRAFQKLHGSTIYKSVTNQDVGWHAVVVVGYDESRQAFRVINSWGQHWGDHGFGWLAYSVMTTDVREAYVMRPLALVAEPTKPIIVAINPPQLFPPKIDEPSPATLPSACSKLEVIASGKGMAPYIKGFTDSKARLSREQPKADVTQVQERPWQQCEMLQTLGNALAQPDKPTVQVSAEPDLQKGGSLLKFKIKTPSFPSFLHVAYLQADGSVVNLIQPSNMALHAYPPNSVVLLGDPSPGRPTFHVAQPYGHEMLIVISSRSPLFDKPLPDVQNARDFLTEMRGALLARPDASSPDRVVAAGFDSVITSEKGIVSVPAPSGM